MEKIASSHSGSKLRNILPYIRWKYLEKVNPRRERKIFVVGLSKTGTTSLHDAFGILGVKSIHYPQCYKLVEGSIRFNWNWRLEQFNAFSDIPVVAFLDDIIASYPDSHIIYTSREKSSWLKSCEKHFESEAINPIGEALREHVYGAPVFDYELFSRKYDHHAELISNKFNTHPRFLELKLESSEKWGPLCRFLKIPVPNIDYPHSNKYQDKR